MLGCVQSSADNRLQKCKTEKRSSTPTDGQNGRNKEGKKEGKKENLKAPFHRTETIEQPLRDQNWQDLSAVSTTPKKLSLRKRSGRSLRDKNKSLRSTETSVWVAWVYRWAFVERPNNHLRVHSVLIVRLTVLSESERPAATNGDHCRMTKRVDQNCCVCWQPCRDIINRLVRPLSARWVIAEHSLKLERPLPSEITERQFLNQFKISSMTLRTVTNVNFSGFNLFCLFWKHMFESTNWQNFKS